MAVAVSHLRQKAQKQHQKFIKNYLTELPQLKEPRLELEELPISKATSRCSSHQSQQSKTRPAPVVEGGCHGGSAEMLTPELQGATKGVKNTKGNKGGPNQGARAAKRQIDNDNVTTNPAGNNRLTESGVW